MRSQRPAFALPFLLLAAHFSCSHPAAPALETVSSLEVVAPSMVAAGSGFPATIRAVGSQGTRPFRSLNGEVTLSASVGTITPRAVTLVDGLATTDITLGAADGLVRIIATHPRASGSGEVDIAALTSLPGSPTDIAAGAIPRLNYAPSERDFDDGHPDHPGRPVSFNHVLVNFAPSATVADANAVIAGIDALIVGGITGSSNGRGGLLMLRVPTTTHAQMDSVVTALQAENAVQLAERDAALTLERVPDNGPAPPVGWTWESTSSGGNWGMELCRMPQMWNLVSGILKRGDPRVVTGIFDGGFDAHPDLFFERVQGQTGHPHGTHVAGIIAAGFDNELGVDGVTPLARLRVASPLQVLSSGELIDGVEVLAAAGARVINLSLGWQWGTSHPDDSPVARSVLIVTAGMFEWTLDALRDAGSMPLLVVAAGNDSNRHPTPVEARWGSPLAYAALELGAGDILVVEAIEVQDGGRRADFSNPGGHVSAPGGLVLSTAPGGTFALNSGTSMAAPHVTGLASFLLSIDPTLTNADLIALITSNTQPTAPNAGVPASERMDGFAAALAIDGLRGDDKVVRMLVDIDDGTPDGNQRVDLDDLFDDFVEEDVDGDGGMGDGRIDMADFRRWRDWYHQLAGTPGADFDGSVSHPKRDVNGNGKVESAAGESVYPRADFNGDGSLEIDLKSVVPGDFTAPQSDFEVIVRYFDDAAFQEPDLETLIFSGDVHVNMDRYFNSGRFDQVGSCVLDDQSVLVQEVEHTASEPVYVYSLEADREYVAAAWGISNGDTLCRVFEVFAPALCEDLYWRPKCSPVTVEITMAELMEPGLASPLLVRAGVVDDTGNVRYLDGMTIDISVSGGTVAASTGVTDGDGFFETEVTMGVNVQELHVFATATDVETGESATAHAVARPLGTDGVAVSHAGYIADARADVGVNGVQAQDQMDDNGEFLDRASFNSSAVASAQANAHPNSAKAEASVSIEGTAVWTQPGVLSTVTFSGDCVAIASTSGPFTEFYGATGQVTGSMEILFDVEASGIEMTVSAVGGLSVVLVRLSNPPGLFYSSPLGGETVTLQVDPGSYGLGATVSTGAKANAPPSSDANDSTGSAHVRFSALPPQTVQR